MMSVREIVRVALMAMSLLAVSLAEAASLPEIPKRQLPDPASLAINRGRLFPFKHPLPRMNRPGGGGRCGTYNNMELSLPGVLTTTDSRLGMFLQKLRETIMATRRMLFVDGREIVCCHNWIRDHVQQMKGWKYWEHRPADFLDFIIATQRADGQFYELVKQLDDNHWRMVGPDCSRIFPEDNVSLVRLELEADVEYLVVEGAWQYHRMTGDDKWLARVLPALEKGIDYQTSDPKRWNAELGLCIRPYTIDTWDFTYFDRSPSDRRIHPDEPMCAMHGDNTGVYEAMNLLAGFNVRLGNSAKAADWRARAETLKRNIMKLLWNGRFFVHQLPTNGAKEYDGRERERLSLSDAYALNRDILTEDECRSVIDAFIERGRSAGTFAEWFTIDPPYVPGFGNKPAHRAGIYVNGAISPFTAGELAKGAFAHGREKYGWNIISRWVEKLEKDGAIYFLYDRETGKSVSEAAGPSAWGAAALMSAVDEGLAGICDADVQYRKLVFSPRWAVTPYREGRYLTGYEFSRKTVDVRWIFTDRGLRYHLRSPAECVEAHLMLPQGRTAAQLLVDGQNTPFAVSDSGEAKYIDAKASPRNGAIDFEIVYGSKYDR